MIKTKIIRLLHIQETIGSGGVEKRRLSLSKLLNKEKFELKIICTNIGGSLPNLIRENNVEVIPIGTFKSLFDIKKYKEVIKIIDKYKPHIVHGAVFEGVTMAAVCGFIKRVPIIIIEETSDPKNRSWRGNFLMRIFGMLSTKAIGVSEASKNYLIDSAGINKNKVICINNGVVIPRAVSEEEQQILKNSLKITSDDVVIGSVGRLLDSHKRFSDLIKAFSILNKNIENTKLMIVGDGPDKENLIKLSKEYNLENNVVFTGYDNDTAKYYAIMDIFSLVSAYEAFGLVNVEAMLLKLPIVATKVGGQQYIIEDNKTGFLVDKFNIEQIAEKLKVLCKNEALRKRMGENGFKRALQNYTEERYVEEMEKLYFSLLNKKKIQIYE